MFIEFKNQWKYPGWYLGIWYSGEDKTLQIELFKWMIQIGKK